VYIFSSSLFYFLLLTIVSKRICLVTRYLHSLILHYTAGHTVQFSCNSRVVLDKDTREVFRLAVEISHCQQLPEQMRENSCIIFKSTASKLV